MDSLKLVFGSAGTTLDLEGSVHGKDATVQAMLVNSIVEKGSDALYPLKGTDLRATLMSGGVVDWASASHASNFAANDTLDFINGFAGGEYSADRFHLSVYAMGGDLVEFDAGFEFNDGTTIGVLVSTEI